MSDLLARFLGLHFHDPAVGVLRAAESAIVRARPLPRPLLDLGTGDGSFAASTLDAPATVGVDRDLGRAHLARASGAYLHVVVADAHRLPFRDGAFAAVLSNSTLEHIPGPGDVLRECARVLGPGGRLLFTLHNERFGQRMFFWPWLFGHLGRPRWSDRYRHARLRRLAMENLMSEAEWRAALAPAGFAVREALGYLSGGAERVFEVGLVLSRFGLGRANIGAALRVLGRALDGMGLDAHRRIAGTVLARLLRGFVARDDGEPAALLVAAERAETVEVSARAQAAVIAFPARRTGSG